MGFARKNRNIKIHFKKIVRLLKSFVGKVENRNAIYALPSHGNKSTERTLERIFGTIS